MTWTFTMGCSVTKVPDPNEMYGNPHSTQNKKNIENGNVQNHNNNQNSLIIETSKDEEKDVPDTSDINISNKSQKDATNRTLKGDLLHRNDKRAERQQKVRDRSSQRDKIAQEMSDKAMDDKEMLSLSSRSRATSRTGSPKIYSRDGSRNIHHAARSVGGTPADSPEPHKLLANKRSPLPPKSSPAPHKPSDATATHRQEPAEPQPSSSSSSPPDAEHKTEESESTADGLRTPNAL